MIAYLKGTIINKGQGFIILEVKGVGYKIHVNPTHYAELEISKEADFYIHQHVREDALDLYGFTSLENLEMFELLLTISGVGPKSALGAMAISSASELKDTIASGDPSLLIKVSGIGKKTAERIVLELKDKVGLPSGSGPLSGGSMGMSGDEIDALMALGYSLQQAREALKEVDTGVKDSGERIREALKKLGK